VGLVELVAEPDLGIARVKHLLSLSRRDIELLLFHPDLALCLGIETLTRTRGAELCSRNFIP